MPGIIEFVSDKGIKDSRRASDCRSYTYIDKNIDKVYSSTNSQICLVI
jgi:hypothetical protein